MFFLRTFIMALRSLWIHPLRSILATVGVIIGVASVVAAMSILEGMTARVSKGFESMGSNRIIVTPYTENKRGRMVGSMTSLKLADANVIRKECDKSRYVGPQVRSENQIKFLSKTTDAAILGATEEYVHINNHHVSEGEFISASDVSGATTRVVLGAKVKRDLFGGRPALDERVRISGPLGSKVFTVKGVMEEKGVIGFTDVDDQVIVPITTAMNRLLGCDYIHMMLIDAVSPSDEDIEAAKIQIKKTLRLRHKIRANQTDDFAVQTQKELVKQFGQIQIIMGIVLGSIAGISLVVGGIGIMNIMLVAVTERTREIGVRMAMGARRGDLLVQFLVEACIISFLGGSVGVITGWGLGAMIEQLNRVLEVITTGAAVAMALAMSTVVGIISGLYPAWKASRLDPVEALRYE